MFVVFLCEFWSNVLIQYGETPEEKCLSAGNLMFSFLMTCNISSAGTHYSNVFILVVTRKGNIMHYQ